MGIFIPNSNGTFHGLVTTQAVQGVVDITYKPRVGGRTLINYEGTLQQITDLASQYEILGWEVHYYSDGPTWKLEAIFSSEVNTTVDNQPVSSWNITGHPVEQGIFDATDRPAIAALQTSTVSLIKNAIQKKIINPTLVTGSFTLNEFSASHAVYALMVQDVHSRQTFVPVVSQTVTVADTGDASWTIDNTGKVLSKDYWVNTYQVPNFIASKIPASVTVTNPSTGIVTNTGMFEDFTTRQNVVGNKVQISRKWTYNKWSDLLYQFVT